MPVEKRKGKEKKKEKKETPKSPPQSKKKNTGPTNPLTGPEKRRYLLLGLIQGAFLAVILESVYSAVYPIGDRLLTIYNPIGVFMMVFYLTSPYEWHNQSGNFTGVGAILGCPSGLIGYLWYYGLEVDTLLQPFGIYFLVGIVSMYLGIKSEGGRFLSFS